VRDASTRETGDFVVLRRNPLEDIMAVYEVDHVFRGGREIANADGRCGTLADNP
jgi:hypothetical protein